MGLMAPTETQAFSLRFISGKYQGGEFPLNVNKQIIIGRSSELDMVLVEDMVSRRHAKIDVSIGGITIEDLGSTNGTFVNGEKVKHARLKEGDRILIGTSILKLIQQGSGTLPLDETSVKQKLEEVAAVQARRGSSMAGKIEEIPLPDLLQLFHTSKKNGVLVVQGEREGKIYLRQGRVYYCVIDDNHELGPRKNFNRIITWEAGDFELRSADPQQFADEMDQSTEGLLMEGLRQLDEYRRIEAELPASGATLMLAVPMGPALRDLSPDELDVLQLVHNFGTLKAVLDHSEKDDVTLAETVLKLIRQEYARAN